MLALFVLKGVGSIGESRHVIATAQVTTGHQVVVTERVMDDRILVHWGFMTRRTVEKDARGELIAIEVTPASRGILVQHYKPTDAEAALWHKYFGV